MLGYSPQPKNLMRLTGEMICDNFQIIRCFDFLNHIDNMRPFAEVALSRRDVVFEPAISMSWANGFDVAHYLGVAEKDCGKGTSGLLEFPHPPAVVRQEYPHHGGLGNEGLVVAGFRELVL